MLISIKTGHARRRFIYKMFLSINSVYVRNFDFFPENSNFE